MANEGSDGDEGEESDEDVVDTARDMIGGKTFGERMTEHVRLLRDFADGLEYQLQFNDHQMLDRLEREREEPSYDSHKVASAASTA